MAHELAPLISRLSSEHTFDYVDAQFEGHAAPGIGEVFSGPYFVWHEKYDPQSVEKVHDFIDTILEEDGPYDGIIGFSEGAALAASYLLAKEYRASLGDVAVDPEKEIKLAILFNSVKPYSPSEQIGHDAAAEFQRELRRHSLFLKGQNTARRQSSLSREDINALTERRQSLLSQRRESIVAWKTSGMPFRKASVASSCEGELSSIDEKAQGVVWNSLFSPVFSFDPDSFPCKIQIPTLNIIGLQDQFQDYSREIVRFCDPDQTEVAFLDIGHDIPRAGLEFEKLLHSLELIFMMASVGGAG